MEIMKHLIMIITFVLLISPVSAAGTWTFQNPDDITNFNLLDGSGFGRPSYFSNTSGGNSYVLSTAVGGALQNSGAEPFTYAAWTDIANPGFRGFTLYGPTNTTSLWSVSASDGCLGSPSYPRIEILVDGGIASVYANGIKCHNTTTTLAVNPSFISIINVNSPTTLKIDDVIIGASQDRIVIGIPLTGAYYIKKDFVNPAASGFYNASTGTQISSNYMTTTFSRSNLSGQALINESIYLIYQTTGTVYETKYTGTASAGETVWNIGSSLIASGAPYGWYQVKLNSTLSNDRIAYIANGANINFDMRDYSIGDNATITYLVDPAYWQPGTYTYRIEIVDAYGTVHNSQNIAASSGSVSYTWTDADTQGVYFAEIIANRISNGEDILMNYDYATVTATFGFNGFVNTAGNATPISGSLVTYSQGDTIDNSTSGFDGNYSVSGFITGIPIWANISATGYQTQNFSFTAQNGHTINRNITLNATSPTFTGLAIVGVTRDGILTNTTITNGYGRPIAGATCYLKNTTNSELYTNTTNNAGGYLFDESTSAFLTLDRPYDLWCSRIGYSNSQNYTVVPSL